MTKMNFLEIYQIDVSKNVEKKMNLSYLSWSWAHAEMKKIDENAEIEIHEFPDTDALIELASNGVEITTDLAKTITTNYKKDKGGAYVKVSVTLNGRTETEFLPVMDFKNKSMVSPDSMSVNKAHKRCFVKALALHGLGLYIYAGEDLPEDAVQQQDAESQKQPKSKSTNQKQEQPPMPCICARCNQPIKRVKLKDGSIMQAAEFAATHDGLCADCYKATRLNVA